MGSAAIKQNQAAYISQIASLPSDSNQNEQLSSVAISRRSVSQRPSQNISSIRDKDLTVSRRTKEKTLTSRIMERTSTTRRILGRGRRIEDSIIERDPLKLAAEISVDEEARTKIIFHTEKHSPGEPDRWSKILSGVNTTNEPTDDNPTPLKINTTLVELRKVLSQLFNEKVTDENTGDLVLLKAIIPQLFKKHSLERAQRISAHERDSRALLDEHYAYGECDYLEFGKILHKIVTTYGSHKKGIFCDLGCGVGQLVYSASIIGSFQKCMGMEFLEQLHLRGEKRRGKWNIMIQESFMPSKLKDAEIVFICDDFMERREWTAATFLLLHWTAFSMPMRKQLSILLDRCSEGTFCVTFSHELIDTPFEMLTSGKCQLSWGSTRYFVYEKIKSIIL